MFIKSCYACKKEFNILIVKLYKFTDGLICKECTNNLDIPVNGLRRKDSFYIDEKISILIKEKNTSKYSGRMEQLIFLIEGRNEKISRYSNVVYTLELLGELKSYLTEAYEISTISTLDTIPPVINLIDTVKNTEDIAISESIKRFYEDLYIKLYDLKTVKGRQSRLKRESQKLHIIIKESKYLDSKELCYITINEQYNHYLIKINNFNEENFTLE